MTIVDKSQGPRYEARTIVLLERPIKRLNQAFEQVTVSKRCSSTSLTTAATREKRWLSFPPGLGLGLPTTVAFLVDHGNDGIRTELLYRHNGLTSLFWICGAPLWCRRRRPLKSRGRPKGSARLYSVGCIRLGCWKLEDGRC